MHYTEIEASRRDGVNLLRSHRGHRGHYWLELLTRRPEQMNVNQRKGFGDIRHCRFLRYWMLERRIGVPKRCPSDPLTCGNVPLHRAPFGRLARGQAFIQQRSIRLYLRHKAFLSSASQQIGNDQYSEHWCEIHDLPSCSIKLNLPGQAFGHSISHSRT